MTAHSPKNKFRAEVHYSEALVGIGSVTSVGGNTIEETKSRINFYINQAHHNGVGCHILISENLATYPVFNWVKIEEYDS
jgi:hypothetical protein